MEEVQTTVWHGEHRVLKGHCRLSTEHGCSWIIVISYSVDGVSEHGSVSCVLEGVSAFGDSVAMRGERPSSSSSLSSTTR